MALGSEAVSSAMTAYAQAHEVTARNIANVATPGFKRNLAVFTGAGGSATASGASDDRGSVQFQRAAVDFSQGALELTGNDLHLAIKGEGFFTIEGENNRIYTRNGNFQLDQNGMLADQQGNPLVGDAGPIQIPPNAGKIVVDDRGNISVDGAPVGRLKLAAFDELERLAPQAGSAFIAPDDMEPREPKDGRVRQGYLERSNVDPINEMVRMLATKNSYDACARSLRSIEESAAKLYSWARG